MRNFLLFMRRRAFRLSATVFQDYIFLIFSGRNSVTLCNHFDIFHLRAWIVLKELHNEFCFDDFLVVPRRRRQAFSLAPPNSAPPASPHVQFSFTYYCYYWVVLFHKSLFERYGRLAIQLCIPGGTSCSWSTLPICGSRFRKTCMWTRKSVRRSKHKALCRRRTACSTRHSSFEGVFYFSEAVTVRMNVILQIIGFHMIPRFRV